MINTRINQKTIDFFGIRKIQEDLINENQEIPEIKSETEKIELVKVIQRAKGEIVCRKM